MSVKRSRVHPKYKTKYSVGNWREYDRGLVRRGDLTLWFSPEAVAVAAWKPPRTGTRGGALMHGSATAKPVPAAVLFSAPMGCESGRAKSVIRFSTLHARTASVR